MSDKLRPKEKKFVKTLLENGGNGVRAALEAYDTDSYNTAGVIAHENLKKPKIQKAIAERIQDDDLEAAHVSLLNAVRLDYFVFPKSMSDEEITGHVSAQGLTVINIRPSEKGKLAFFSLPDGAARGKGLELGYKLKGSFAPDKHVNLNVTVEPNERIKNIAKRLNGVE